LKESARSNKQEARGNQESGIRKKTAYSVLNFREVIASFLTNYSLSQKGEVRILTWKA
jgi:hypothetical protein